MTSAARTAGLCCLLALGLCCPLARAATLTAGDGGLAIDAGSMGVFTLSYPILLSETNDELLKPIEVQATGKQAVVTYAGGARLTLSVRDDGTVDLTGSGLPAVVRKYRMDMLIDFGFAEGGTWQAGDGPSTPFPKDKPEKPHLYQGSTSLLRLTNFEGKTLTLETPQYSYQQLQDNREWNWKTFAWMFIAPVQGDAPRSSLRIAEGTVAGGAQRVVVVDRFGQDATLEFPGKVKTEDELRADVAADEAYYGSLTPPSTDTYGGAPGSGTALGLRATGFFHVEQAAGRWLLVDPEGNAVFHLGICGFQPSDDYTYIKGREQIYEWLPPYEGEYRTAFHTDPYWSRDAFSFYLANVIRKYGRPYDLEEWAGRAVARARTWGFNASGAFSGPTRAQKDARFPYVLHLPLSEWELGGAIPGLRGLFDPFDEATRTKMAALFAERVAPAADDPLIIGYFLANEQAFEDIPRVIPSLTADQPAKRRLVEMLRAKYGAIGDLNAAWGLTAESFDALVGTGLPVATRAASEDMQAFTALFLDEYFRLIAETFRASDGNHLLLGNRWQPGTANNELLCRTAGRYLDVISVNYYTYATDIDFLNRISQWTGNKPMILSEFYWASPSDTGLPGGKEVRSQRERGLAYRNYVERGAALPYVVGIEWFTLIDQARSGRWFERYTGEKANTGLLSVADRPYRDCLDEMMKTNYTIDQVMLGKRPAFTYDDPLFASSGSADRSLQIARATGAMRIDGSRDDWPGTPPERIGKDRLVEGADAGGLEGVFRLCWDDANLYLLAEIADPTPMRNDHRADAVWSGDAVELFLGTEDLDQPGPLLFSDRQVLLSAGLPDGAPQWWVVNAPKQYPCQLTVVPNVGGTGYTLEAAIPFEALGFAPRAGQQLRFDLAIDGSEDGDKRTAQLVWNGTARNSGDRTHWGGAVLSE